VAIPPPFRKGAAWIKKFKKDYNGFDPVAFWDIFTSGKLMIVGKDEMGFIPFIPNRQQIARATRIIQNRRNRVATREIDIKIRQLAGATTGMAAFDVSEAFSNDAASSLVSAIQAETIDGIWAMYRMMYSNMQSEVPEDAEKKRKAREGAMVLQFAHTGSRMVVQNAGGAQGGKLGRGVTPIIWHASEADYYPNFDKARNSVMPGLSKAPASVGVIETTMDHDTTTSFRDWVVKLWEKQKKDITDIGDWKVIFTPWYEADKCRYKLREGEKKDIESSLTPDELILLKDYDDVDMERIAWRRYTCNDEFGGNYAAFREAYPASMDEALDVSSKGKFFREDAIEFIGQQIREPIRYMLADSTHSSPLRVAQPEDVGVTATLRVWEPPSTGYTYSIGVDVVDVSDDKEQSKGSESYVVVVCQQTGVVCATWWWRGSGFQLANALNEIGHYYNIAEIAIEVPVGVNVLDRLKEYFNYPKIYRMENFHRKNSHSANPYGWKTDKSTRPMMVDTVRQVINERRVTLYDDKAFDQIIAFGKRNGAKQRHQSRATQVNDDFVDAFAIACCMRRNWKKWAPRENDIGLKPNAERQDFTVAKPRDDSLLRELIREQKRAERHKRNKSRWG